MAMCPAWMVLMEHMLQWLRVVYLKLGDMRPWSGYGPCVCGCCVLLHDRGMWPGAFDIDYLPELL